MNATDGSAAEPGGIRIPVLRYRVFNYSFLVSPATASLIIAPAIPVAEYRSALLEVRLHTGEIASGGARYNFEVKGVNPSAGDGQDFVTANLASSTSITSSTTYPTVLSVGSAALKDLQYPAIRIVLSARGPSSAGALYLQASADLVLRAS